ncbi:polar amino acid transport system substrate-binding protein [Pseudomonas duriflava]|uniref:Polar amino acid transport system substrate-binding protein n=1 Tax=Pseudomonas duriflava TaxID=459528 RepID=A0A562QKX7_9PSED|nr:transporter substrate-binding domain-containing protein [Pseudomonas duriflava]TWI57333.1 polar amino acid transport system substrate-binding protein [Pseudomonas duriflava]
MFKRWPIFLTLTAGLMAQLPAQADQLADIQERGTIRIAVPQDFPPFGSVGPDLKPRGLDIDTAHLIADKLGTTLVLVPVTSTNRIPFLTTGKVDLVISSLGKSAEREMVIDFSKPYAPFFLGVFGPKDMKISAPADLSGKVIGVTRGGIEDIELSKQAPEDANIKRFEDNNATIAAYLAGQTELIASGSSVMAAIADKNPERTPVMKITLKNSPNFVGLNKGETALKDRVNAIIDTARTDGTLNGVSQRWLGQPLPADM